MDGCEVAELFAGVLPAMHHVIIVVIVIVLVIVVVVLAVMVVSGVEVVVIARKETASPDAIGKTGETNADDASKCPERVVITVVRSNAGCVRRLLLLGRAGDVDAGDRVRDRDGVVRVDQKRTKVRRTMNPPPPQQQRRPTKTVLLSKPWDYKAWRVLSEL